MPDGGHDSPPRPRSRSPFSISFRHNQAFPSTRARRRRLYPGRRQTEWELDQESEVTFTFEGDFEVEHFNAADDAVLQNAWQTDPSQIVNLGEGRTACLWPANGCRPWQRSATGYPRRIHISIK